MVSRGGTRIPGFVIVAAAIALGFGSSSGTAASPTGPTAAAKPTLRIGTLLGSRGFGPFDLTDDSFRADLLVSEGALRRRADGSFAPGLAVSWGYVKPKARSGEANKVFRFTLRRNARFADGTRVTALAVKRWFDYVSAYHAQTDKILPFFVPITSVETRGQWTVILRFASPHPEIRSFLATIGAGPAAVSSPACIGKPTVLSSGAPCGAGPYVVLRSETVAGDHVTLVPNRYYYDKSKQRWGKIIVKAIPVASSMLQALQAGQIDVAAGDPSTVRAARAAGFSITAGGGFNPMLVPDFKRVPAFADVRVRQAMNYAIDRVRISRAFGNGFAPATSQIPTWDGMDPAMTRYYRYNPARARALLAAAGHSRGLSVDVLAFGVWGALGTPTVQAIARYLSDVGITINVRVAGTHADWGAGFRSADVFQGPFGVDSMWRYYGIFMKPNGPFNGLIAGGGWNDPVINRLYVQGSRSANPSRFWRQISRRATQRAYWVPTVIIRRLAYVNSKKVRNARLNVNTGYPNMLEWRPAR